MLIPVIPVLAGWGGGAKAIAYAGIAKCENCKNYGHYYLVEASKKASVLFVPIAKWSKKYYLVCSICEVGFEVTESEKQEILVDSVSLPDADVAGAIWDALDIIMAEVVSEGDRDEAEEADAVKAIDNAIAQLHEQYAPEHVDYVRGIFAECISDPDQPE